MCIYSIYLHVYLSIYLSSTIYLSIYWSIKYLEVDSLQEWKEKVALAQML